MNDNNKRIIYNAESFTNIIAEINNHIANISNCFSDEFTLESYKGSQKENIELAINNILNTLKHFLDGLNNIPDDLLAVKQRYEEVVSAGQIAVNGGDRNV